MSLSEFLDLENVKTVFFSHIETCPRCKKVHADGWGDLCPVGIQLMDDFKVKVRNECESVA